MILEDLLSRYPRGREPTLRVNFVASVDGAVTVDGKHATVPPLTTVSLNQKYFFS